LDNHFKVEQRSWLRVLSGIPNEIAPIATVSAKNIGKSVITEILAQGVLEIVPSNQDPSFAYPAPNILNVVSMMVPDDTMPPFNVVLSRSQKTFTPDEIVGMKAGELYIVLYGIILYKDAFRGPLDQVLPMAQL
jgi:hypothetical protein